MNYQNFQKKSPYYYKGCRCHEKRGKKIVIILANALLLLLVIYLATCFLSLHPSTHGSAPQLPLNAPKQQQPPQHPRLRAAKDISVMVLPTKLILKMHIGEIVIVLRPDLSPETVDYVRKLATVGACERCMFYRAEKPGILQGVMAHSKVPVSSTKGTCPAGVESVHNECPPWDTSCGCHGPVMTRGMVGWAAGKTGPDFFINMYAKPAVWWGTQHTVFGEIQDEASFKLFDDVIWNLPIHAVGGLHHLDEPVSFEMQLQ
jgi:cyclophilin family peptidyl-prolyl cis-trans isomerase